MRRNPPLTKKQHRRLTYELIGGLLLAAALWYVSWYFSTTPPSASEISNRLLADLPLATQQQVAHHLTVILTNDPTLLASPTEWERTVENVIGLHIPQ